VSIALNEYVSELRDVTCHVGSHSVTCHPTQVNANRLHPSKAGTRFTYLGGMEGWVGLAWVAWLSTKTVYPRTVTHLSTNPAWHKVTALLQPNCLVVLPAAAAAAAAVVVVWCSVLSLHNYLLVFHVFVCPITSEMLDSVIWKLAQLLGQVRMWRLQELSVVDYFTTPTWPSFSSLL